MLITTFISILILFGVAAYLHYTKRLIYLRNLNWKLLINNLKKFEKWILSATLVSVIVLNILTSSLSSLLNEILFPTPYEEILENQDKIEKTVSDSNSKIEELLKKSQIDPRDIEQYLQELLKENGKDETETKIKEWYKKRKISSDEKELLLVVISIIHEQNNVLSREIGELKSKGKTEIAELLEAIQKHLAEGDAEKIKDVYFSRKEKLKQENIRILKESIKATEILFSYNQTRVLYKELILLEPSAGNYFNFAKFLYEYNFLNDAADHYQTALKIYRDLAKENPGTYLPYVAGTLNNLAVLQHDKNEYPQALKNYEEALKIRRDLAKENPGTYLS
ncbi:MAG: tetratricopeptide repeat protein [Ignavibacteria bacterium]|jgi:tetratricopeptide (TPR) repeat protein